MTQYGMEMVTFQLLRFKDIEVDLYHKKKIISIDFN